MVPANPTPSTIMITYAEPAVHRAPLSGEIGEPDTARDTPQAALVKSFANLFML